MTEKSKLFDIGVAGRTVRVLTTQPTTRFYSGQALEKMRRDSEAKQCEIHRLEDTPQTRTLLNAYKVKRSRTSRRKKSGVTVMGNPVILNMKSELYDRLAAKLAIVTAEHKAKRDNWKARYKVPTKRHKH